MEKQIIQQLNNLKNIKPDENWKQSYRDILLSQISSSQSFEEPKFSWSVFAKSFVPKQINFRLAGPVWVTTLVLTIIFSGGAASIFASRDTKPGDSFYLAKLVSEKAQLAMTFDETDKAKLSLEFASNRAKELSQVISDTKVGESDKKVESLSRSFKKEISEAKSRLAKINVAVTTENKPAGENEEQVFGANAEKTEQGMQLSEPKRQEASADNQGTANSTPSQIATSTPAEAEVKLITPDKILEEAEKLFDEKNYSGTVNKLEEANKIIEGQNGQVKGINESATSTK